MKLEDILKMWEEDSVIDRSKLSDEALDVYKLHAKYYRIYINEKLLLRKHNSDLDVLRAEKYDFYTQGPTRETEEKGWKLPPIGKILKADANRYVDVDKDIVDLTLKIGIQQEKVGLLDSIIGNIKFRSNTIRTALDAIKFEAGY